MSRKNILSDIEKLVKKVAVAKTAALKQASPGDGVEDGTAAPQTGEQLAKNKEEAAKSTAAMVDGQAKANPANGSVEMSTEGATAVATDGQSGAKGADLEVKKEAPNGKVPESELSKTSAVEDILAELEKFAAAADEAPVVEPKREEKTAAAAPVPAKEDVKTNAAMNLLKKAFAADELNPLERFLVNAARAAGVKTAAEMGDQALAGHAADQLVQQIQSGAISEEDAEKMLMEAVQSGAISEQDLMEAMQAIHGQGAPGGDSAGAPAPAPAGDAMGGGAGPQGAAPAAPADPAMEQKIAAADIGPEHPLYLKKLASLYSDDVNSGYAFGLKLAEDLTGAAPAPAPDMAGAAPAPGPEAAPAPGPEAAGAATDPMADVKPSNPQEEQALLQLLKEMGISSPADLEQLMHAQAPAPTDPAQAKIAEFKIRARTAILTKVAAIAEAVEAK